MNVPETHQAAIRAGLRYVSDHMPGIRRERYRDGFRYRYASGEVVGDKAVLARIKALAIPPAWKGVWISPDPAAHLQATGRDVRNRKQSRYHAQWREVRDEAKFNHILGFARALPRIRARVARDLRAKGLPRRKVLAAVVRLLERTHIRIGNDEYARENESFGLTTIRNRHATVRGGLVQFRFRGKSGKFHGVALQDPRLAKIVKKCQDLPGQELFEYLDDSGVSHDIKSTHVNEYLRKIAGEDVTAKDFRTWAGTLLAGIILSRMPPAANLKAAKRNLSLAIGTISARLGNTPAICRKCYVHPEVMSAYLDGTLTRQFRLKKSGGRTVACGVLEEIENATRRLITNSDKSRKRGGLAPEESAVVRFLKRRFKEKHKAEVRPTEQKWMESGPKCREFTGRINRK